MPNILSTDNLEITYNKYGKGDDLILFIHGWSCDQTYWKKQIEFFEKNYRVVTLDLGGHGCSGTNRRNFTMSSFGDDVLSVVNQFKYENLFIVGHSMGGMVALDAASKIDGKKVRLFLVDEVKIKYWPIAEDRVQNFLKPFRENFKDHTKTWLINSDKFVQDSDPKLVDWISTDMSNSPPEVSISCIHELFTRDYDETIAKLRKRNIPMTLINNNESNEKDRRELIQLGFTIEVIPNVGHFIMMEKPEEFNQKLLELIISE